jgi:oxygen-independent coproporphyrinogen-3 oxidase
VYEEFGFRPDRFDMAGFGPSGISFAGASARAVKVINPDGAGAYVQAVERRGPVWDRQFRYSPWDLRIFYLTRRLAALRIDRMEYFREFESDPLEDFPSEFRALEEAGLICVSSEAVEPTPVGMFYADSIAGLLAWQRVRYQPARNAGIEMTRAESVQVNDNAPGYM